MAVTSQITVVPYMYRDASNYKAHTEVHLAGTITPEQVEQVRQSLASIVDEHTGFIPEQIGWDHAGANESSWNGLNYEDDHCWHELDVDDIYVTSTSNPPPSETVREWVNKMVNAAAEGWDDVTYAVGNEEED